MQPTANTLPSRALIGPVSWVGQSVLAVPAYMGGVTLLAVRGGRLGRPAWPGRRG